METPSAEIKSSVYMYKLRLEETLLDKIEYLCKKIPNQEWSGILFYTVQGDFENNDLILTATDLCLQDIGTTEATEFEISTDVAWHISQNNLEGHQMGLIHSHHGMDTFFSGVDRNTLISEGNDRNHFLSLIVNNAGNYTAKITRKVHYTKEITKSYSYLSFNNVPYKKEGIKDNTDEVIVEDFPLIIEKSGKDRYKDLDMIIEDLKSKKETFCNKFRDNISVSKKSYTHYPLTDYFPKNSKPVYSKKPSTVYGSDTLFHLKSNDSQILDIVKKIVSGSPLVTSLSCKELIEDMEALYEGSFAGREKSFYTWATEYVEYLITDAEDSALEYKPGYDIAEFESDLATSVLEELNKLQNNKWLEKFKEILMNYIL